MKSTNAPELEIEKGYQMNSKQMAKGGQKVNFDDLLSFWRSLEGMFLQRKSQRSSREYKLLVDKRDPSRIGSAFKAETNNYTKRVSNILHSALPFFHPFAIILQYHPSAILLQSFSTVLYRPSNIKIFKKQRFVLSAIRYLPYRPVYSTSSYLVCAKRWQEKNKREYENEFHNPVRNPRKFNQ